MLLGIKKMNHLNLKCVHFSLKAITWLSKCIQVVLTTCVDYFSVLFGVDSSNTY